MSQIKNNTHSDSAAFWVLVVEYDLLSFVLSPMAAVFSDQGLRQQTSKPGCSVMQSLLYPHPPFFPHKCRCPYNRNILRPWWFYRESSLSIWPAKTIESNDQWQQLPKASHDLRSHSQSLLWFWIGFAYTGLRKTKYKSMELDFVKVIQVPFHCEVSLVYMVIQQNKLHTNLWHPPRL